MNINMHVKINIMIKKAVNITLKNSLILVMKINLEKKIIMYKYMI